MTFHLHPFRFKASQSVQHVLEFSERQALRSIRTKDLYFTYYIPAWHGQRMPVKPPPVLDRLLYKNLSGVIVIISIEFAYYSHCTSDSQVVFENRYLSTLQ